jgi:hypothetical protein
VSAGATWSFIPHVCSTVFFKGAVSQFRIAFRLGSIRISSGISSHICFRIKPLFHHWSSQLPACLNF